MQVFRFAPIRSAAGVLFAALLAWSASPVRSQDSSDAEHTVSVGGTERTYVVHIPPNAERPAAVVLLFHGGGGRPEAIARRSGMNDVADRHGFIVVYPTGAPREPGGERGTWNVGGADSPSSADDVAFVQAILTDLAQAAPIDRTRVYATGLSMGGVFSYRLACEMSDTFAAIAPVSATMVEPSCRPSSPVAVLHIHGAEDDRIPISGGRGAKTAANRLWPAPQEGLASWSKIDSCSGQPTRSDEGGMSCTTYGQCSATVEYCVIAEGGHNWPEGASERIWAFFEANRKQTH